MQVTLSGPHFYLLGFYKQTNNRERGLWKHANMAVRTPRTTAGLVEGGQASNAQGLCLAVWSWNDPSEAVAVMQVGGQESLTCCSGPGETYGT